MEDGPQTRRSSYVRASEERRKESHKRLVIWLPKEDVDTIDSISEAGEYGSRTGVIADALVGLSERFGREMTSIPFHPSGISLSPRALRLARELQERWEVSLGEALNRCIEDRYDRSLTES